MSKRVTVPIAGMHCNSCTIMVKDMLSMVDGIDNIKVSLKDASATFVAEGEVPKDEIVRAVKKAGYKVGYAKQPWINFKDYRVLLIGVFLSVIIFWLFSKVGISPQLLAATNANNVTAYALLMGLTAGFSTCMALVGGLVIGVSARHEQNHPNATRLQNFYPHVAFNLGRIFGFTVLGGVLGLLGSALTFSATVQGVLTLLVGIFMLVIGLQLTGLFPRLTAFSLPPKLAEKLGITDQKNKDYSHWRSGFLGVLTFFLPCGFTQAMQLFAVSTGSFASGALAMGLFAIGTTPGLLLVGGAASLMNGKKGQTALKMVGVLVAMLALLSINSGLTLTGFRLPQFTRSSSVTQQDPSASVIKLVFQDPYKQFNKTEIDLSRGNTYQIEIQPLADGFGCMSTIMLPGLTDGGPQLIKKDQPIVYKFKADKSGVYNFRCAMGIPFNTKIVVGV